MVRTINKVLSVILALAIMLSLNVCAFAYDETETETETVAETVTESETEKPFADSEFFTDGDYNIHYRIIPADGERKGRILFIHGFLYSGSTWNDTAKEISAEGYDCVLADLPDFGYSTRETFDTDYISRERLMIDLMESIAPLSEWIVAGHAMGGGIAANIASSNPEIRALMLYAPAVQSKVSSVYEKAAKNDKLMSSVQRIANNILNMKFIVKSAVGYIANDMSYGFGYDVSILSKPLKIDGTMRGICVGCARSEQTDITALSNIDIPVLLVWASDDVVLGNSKTSVFSTALAGRAQTHYVDGGHIFIESHFHKTADITLGFLSELN